MRDIIRSLSWGLCLGVFVLGCAEALRPGFLGLESAAGWWAATLALGPFLAAGLLWGLFRRLRRAGSGSRSVTGRISILVLAVGLPLLARFLTTPAPEPRRGRPPVVLLGVDGATWEVIDGMIGRGELPHFERLKREGATGVLMSEAPTLSPRVWTTIASGVGPEVHGAEDFASTRSSIRVRRVWEVVRSEGGTVGLWGWLLTWPPEGTNGFVVPGWMARGPETRPPELGFFQRLKGGGARQAGLVQLVDAAFVGYLNGVRLPTLVDAAGSSLWMKLARPSDREFTPRTMLLQSQIAADSFVYWLRRTGPDFAALVLYATDTLAHRYWKDYEPQRYGLESPPDGGRFAEAIPDAYRQIDRVLGRLMEMVGRDAVLAVISDHGTSAQSETHSAYTIRSNRLIHALGRKGELTAFTVGGILLMREVSEDDRNAADGTPEFVSDLLQATVAGEQVFEIEPGDPPFFQVRLRGRPSLSQTLSIAGREVPLSSVLLESEFSGDHALEGIIGLWGAPIEPGAALRDATLRDVAPTLLALMDCPLSAEMSGRVLEEGLTSAVRGSLEVRVVPSYPPPERSVDRTPEGREIDGDLEEKLRALGYIQ